jgi:predicted nucleotidyltransferase
MTKTASDLKKAGWPREDLIKYRPWQAMERYGRDRDLIFRRNRAWEVACKAATILKERFGATRVLVFGSLAHGAWFTPRSDIDLLADGIPAEKFFHAEADVEAVATGYKVDLVDSRECSPELLEQVEEEGVEL